MNQRLRLEFPLAKAEYLLTCAAEPGQGGDKQNFWRGVMGFESADEIREALLAVVSTDMLQPQGQNAFGDRYQASVPIEDLALIAEMEDRLGADAAEVALAEEGENIKLADLKAELGL